MTQITFTGKEINAFAMQRNDLPDYFGRTIYTGSPEYKKVKTSGEFVAKRYKDILKTIEEVKGTVFIQKHSIHVNYSTGRFTIQRDLLTDTFLLPYLKN